MSDEPKELAFEDFCKAEARAGCGKFAIAYAMLRLCDAVEQAASEIGASMPSSFADPETIAAATTIADALYDHTKATQNIAAMLDIHSCGKPPRADDDE